MTDRKLELPDGVPPLNTYYVYLTGGCNLACRHCWISPSFQANGGTGGHLDYDLFALAIEEGLPLGLKNVKLTGGEPLLHPDFIRIVDLISEKKLGLTIETNGTLMTESIAHHLKEKSTLGHISVSLDGATADTHDPFRGVKGSFEKAVQGVRYLVEVGFSPQIIMSIHAGNVEEIEALVRLAEKLGCGSVKFNLIQPSGRGEMMIERGQTLDIQRLVELGRWVEGDLKESTAIRLHYGWPTAFRSIKQLLSGGTTDTCGIFNVLGVLSSGYLAMCGIGTQMPDLCYGMLKENSVSNIWNSHPMLIRLRQELPSNLKGICGKCAFRNKCLGSCVANNYLLTNSLSGSNWFCQLAADSQIFPISRRQNVDFVDAKPQLISEEK
jgi:SynChlorMet cassette radical SAM/SPASM protein ScmF